MTMPKNNRGMLDEPMHPLPASNYREAGITLCSQAGEDREAAREVLDMMGLLDRPETRKDYQEDSVDH